jgi:hypothetical protein
LAEGILETTIQTLVLVVVDRPQLRMLHKTMHPRGRSLEPEDLHETEQDEEVVWMNSKR